MVWMTGKTENFAQDSLHERKKKTPRGGGGEARERGRWEEDPKKETKPAAAGEKRIT